MDSLRTLRTRLAAAAAKVKPEAPPNCMLVCNRDGSFRSPADAVRAAEVDAAGGVVVRVRPIPPRADEELAP